MLKGRFAVGMGAKGDGWVVWRNEHLRFSWVESGKGKRLASLPLLCCLVPNVCNPLKELKWKI